MRLKMRWPGTGEFDMMKNESLIFVVVDVAINYLATSLRVCVERRGQRTTNESHKKCP